MSLRDEILAILCNHSDDCLPYRNEEKLYPGCRHSESIACPISKLAVATILQAVDAHINERAKVAAYTVADRSWVMSYGERFSLAKEIIVKAMADEGEVY